MAIDNIMNPSEPIDASPNKAVVAVKKRSTRSLFPKPSESERRAKQRLIVKRCYYKKISTLNTLRDEVGALEQQFRFALRTMQQEDKHVKDLRHREDAKLRKMLIDTLAVKETMREEHILLRRLADEYYMKNQSRLRQLLDSDHKGLILFTAAVND